MGSTIHSGSEFPLLRTAQLLTASSVPGAALQWLCLPLVQSVETSDLDRALEGLELPFLSPFAFRIVASFLPSFLCF